MARYARFNRFCRALVAAGAMGTVLGSSCTTSDLRAVIDGVEAVAQRFADDDRGTDINFGDWLLSELAN